MRSACQLYGHAHTGLPYHVDVLEFLQQFAVSVLQTMSLVNDTHTPLDVAQFTLWSKDDLIGCYDNIELVRTRYDSALQQKQLKEEDDRWSYLTNV